MRSEIIAAPAKGVGAIAIRYVTSIRAARCGECSNLVAGASGSRVGHALCCARFYFSKRHGWFLAASCALYSHAKNNRPQILQPELLKKRSRACQKVFGFDASQ